MMSRAYLLFGCLLMLSLNRVSAQKNEMLIEQIAGKVITRENFASNGKLTGKQVFTAEKLERASGYFVKIKTEIYDETQKLKTTFSTTYRCSPEKSNVLLSVFALNPKKQKILVTVKSQEFKKLYDLDPKNMLRNLSFTMYIESGILNFLGSKNKINLANRLLKKGNAGWEITEDLIIKAYLLGIQMKTIKYKVTEYLSYSSILEKQIFEQSDGSSFTITY